MVNFVRTNRMEIVTSYSLNKIRYDMMGINEKRELVSGKFAQGIRERMHRIQSGQLNEKDKAEIRRHKQMLKKVSVVWK